MRPLLLTLFTFFSILTVAQTYSGGMGTISDPYLITYKSDLQYLSENSTEWVKHFKQTNDIIFDSTDFQVGGAFYNNGEGFLPIAYSSFFSGSYDGAGNSITELRINRPSSNLIGLFSKLDSNSKILNLGLINVNIVGNDYTGSLVGRMYENSIVEDCYSSGVVIGRGWTGGLIGLQRHDASTSNC